MGDSPATTGDGPDAVLTRLVRRLRLPYSRSFIAARVAGHPQPTSLLALVEVGAQLGLKITAGRTDAAALDGLDLPAVVHLGGDGSVGGFAVLEATPPDGVVLWDSTAGRRQIDRHTFLDSWSGVVALVDRDGAERLVEDGYRRRRLLERLAPRSGPPTLAGRGSVAAALRMTVVALTGMLLVLAVAGHPQGTRSAAVSLVITTVLGLAVATALATATARGTGPGAMPGCPRGRIIDCQGVLTSPYSRIGGIPLSEIAAAFFGAVLLVLATAAVWPQGSAVWAAAGAAYVAGLPAVAVLVALQIRMRQVCTWCLLAHVVVVSGAVMAREFVAGVWSLQSFAALVLFGVLSCLLLFAVIPHFTRAPRLQALLGRQQRINSSPYATLAHLLTETPTPVRGPDCGVRLDGAAAAHEVVVFVHPTCPPCASVLRQAEALAAGGTAEVFVAIAPRDGRERERRACAALIAAGLARGAGALVAAYLFAKNDHRSLVAGNPLQRVADHLGVEVGVLRDHADDADAIVSTAAAMADEHVEGTPAVFVDARLYPFTAPLSHLALLLEHHAELLAATRAGREEATGG